MSAQPLDELIAEAEIGEEAKNFKESNIGRCLIGMANQEAEAALEALAKVNPTDVQAIERLQNRVWLGRNFEQFVEELITRGQQALEVWKHGKENERGG